MIVSTCHGLFSSDLDVENTTKYLAQHVIPVGSPDAQCSAIYHSTQNLPRSCNRLISKVFNEFWEEAYPCQMKPIEVGPPCVRA